MSTTVEALVDSFCRAGCGFIAGVPGEESLELMEVARGRGLRFILTKQESAAAMMAASWGELTGIPGLCLSTRAPGAANMVLGVTHAWMDRAPLIAMTDQFAAPAYAAATRQRLDQMALYTPITKWHSSIVAETAYQQARRALRTAVHGVPGPVQLDVPADQRLREAGDWPGDVPFNAEAPAVAPDRASLRDALALIDRSRSPILLVGAGIFWDNASAALTALAERLGAPVMTTPKAKGAIAEDHPLSAGCFFGGAMERELIEQADLIVTVGLDAVELQPVPWPYRTPLLSLGRVRDLDGPSAATIEIVASLDALLPALAEFAAEGSGWGEAAARAFRGRVASVIDIRTPGLAPQRVMAVARSIMPRDTIATCDVGASRLFSVPSWPVYGAKDYLCSNGIATMGFSLPAALGARFAHPDRPVLAMTGDGSFLMAIAELQTSVAEKLPVTILVQDNGGLGVMSMRQDLRGVPRTGTAIGGVDWEHLAKTFGVECRVVETEQSLADALSGAAHTQQTTIIAARMDPAGYGEQYRAMLSAQRA